MKQLTFSEYISSKEQLLSSLNRNPISIQRYAMTKYAKISIGESLNAKDMFILRPKDIIKVKWEHINEDIKCLKMIIDGQEYPIYWKDEKVKLWLSKNTKET